MDFPRLRAIATRVVIASMPTLAGCSGFATYVVPMEPNESCEHACSGLLRGGDASGPWLTGVNACTTGNFVEADASRDVAVCRIVVTGPGGRRPAGLWEEDARDAGWFARMARLEAASVPAFLHLARELEAHGAPNDLIAGARDAAREERRHARTMARWRDRTGGAALSVRVEPTPVRSLEEMAIENAAEGCAGETWGALIGIHQSLAVPDPELRRDMARIADEELGHAHLSLSIDAWARQRISRAARNRVRDARESAFDAFDSAPEESARIALGLPDGRTSRRLLSHARALATT